MSSYELGRVTDRKPPFRYAALARVWFSDTDAQGVVYHGRYMPYFDHSRVEYHRHLGLTAGPDLDIAMRASSVEYVAPARFDDLLEVFVRASRLGTTSVTFDHAAYRVEDDALMCTAQQTLVFIDAQRRKAASPPDSRRAVAAFEAGR
jgi:acyl-CoA thioester hydrolase